MNVRTTVRTYSRRMKAVMGSAQQRRHRADMQGYHLRWGGPPHRHHPAGRLVRRGRPAPALTRDGGHAMRIGILLFEDVEELDAVGPWEVFGMWERLWPGAIELLSLARTAGPIRAAKGLTLLADHGFADVGRLDVLLHPGGKGTRPLVTDEEHLEWVGGLRAGTPLMTSVCTGALV